jgi:polyhydroxybutyrate depolymerase
MTLPRVMLAAAVLTLLAACDSSAPTVPTGATASPTRAAGAGTPGATVTVDLDKRPFQLHVPKGYDKATKAPLVVLLHGYTASGSVQEFYFKLTAESDKRGFLYAMPDGTENAQGKRFWNATEACCDFARTGVDDVGYLHRIIEKVKASYSVDPTRVYLVGHSNGGFMAYRMACDRAGEITAIAVLAGAPPAACKPSRPVSVLQIHGTLDRTIPYRGGAIGGHTYPGAVATIANWRRLDGCSDRADTAAPRLDLDSSKPGKETSVSVYAGCRGGTRVELWSIKDGAHVPPLAAGFAPAVMDFLYGRVA